MANTCITEFRITGTRKSLSTLKSAISKAQEAVTDNGGYWLLFDILNELKIKNYRQVDTRATASNIHITYWNDGYMLNFVTESAWEEPYKLFCLINDKLNLNLTINYIAEEPMTNYVQIVDKNCVFPKGYRLFEEGEFD